VLGNGAGESYSDDADGQRLASTMVVGLPASYVEFPVATVFAAYVLYGVFLASLLKKVRLTIMRRLTMMVTRTTMMMVTRMMMMMVTRMMMTMVARMMMTMSRTTMNRMMMMSRLSTMIMKSKMVGRLQAQHKINQIVAIVAAYCNRTINLQQWH